MGTFYGTEAKRGGRPPGKIDASLDKKLKKVKWGEYRIRDIFNQIEQGRRLKKDDQLPGEIPFVMAGTTNAGIANYISNPVATFPANSITIDIFGNTFYRNYIFGAGDDTGVYWNDSVSYSENTMLFLAMALSKALRGKFSFGKKLRSSRSKNFTMLLPVKNGKIDFRFMEEFIDTLKTQRLADLGHYISAAGYGNTVLTKAEKKALREYSAHQFTDFSICELFVVKNTANILSEDIIPFSGRIPYLCASAENNSVSSYITYDPNYLEKGNCIFIGGKTLVVTYQPDDFFSNDSHNLALYLKNKFATKEIQLILAACIHKSLSHKYSWGYSISTSKIQKDSVYLPSKDGQPDYKYMKVLASALIKQVIGKISSHAETAITVFPVNP